jgi:uncharacterized RDD family membrane protein YckC
MHNQDQLLDDYQFEDTSNDEVFLSIASNGQRFVNYFVDQIVLRIFVYCLGFLLSFLDIAISMNNILFIIGFAFFILFGYYWFCESVFGGRTLGKLLSGTKVVDEQGYQPSSLSILGRALARIVPFEPLSIFFNNDGIMWHDQWSGTLVVDIKSSTLPEEI